jgi:uncharacterized protein YoxC
MYFFQLAAAADTVLVRNVPALRTPFEQVVFVASGLTSILALILVCVALVLLLVVSARAEDLRQKLDELMSELKPMARHLNEMAAESRGTATDVNRRVRKSVRVLTRRVNQMSEIIGRVNSSAERVATVATTTMAGIKFGARALGFSRRKKKRRRDGDERPRLRRRA